MRPGRGEGGTVWYLPPGPECDLCGADCKPIKSLYLRYPFKLGSGREIRVSNIAVFVPYGTREGDVCEECLVEALKAYIKDVEAK